MKIKLLLVVCLWAPLLSFGQQAFSIKPNVFGYHPYADPNNAIAPKRMGPDGTFAQEPGIMLGYERYLYKTTLGLKTHAGFFKDNANKSSMMMHLGVRVRTASKNQAVTFSVGPSYFMRQSWNDVPGYQHQAIWSESDSWQSKVVWLSGELELLYAITPQHNLNFSFNHLAPQTFSFSIGYSYWMLPDRRSHRSNYSGRKGTGKNKR